MSLFVDIKKDLGAFHLDVAFEAEGQVLALLGPSGCGKSMTLKCIAGIERPDRGRVVLNGRVLFDSEKRVDLTPQQRRVGYLFQQYALFPSMSVEKNVMAGACRLPREQRGKAAGDMMERMHLGGLEKKKPRQLSGGQQQRVALARILVNSPELLLLDEPFSALDSSLKWELELGLTESLNAFGGETVYVSHDGDEVARICSAVCPMENGKSGVRQPVAEYFASRSRDLGQNLAECGVISVSRSGGAARLLLSLPGGDRLTLEMPLERWLALGEPKLLQISIDPQKIMVLN